MMIARNVTFGVDAPTAEMTTFSLATGPNTRENPDPAEVRQLLG